MFAIEDVQIRRIFGIHMPSYTNKPFDLLHITYTPGSVNTIGVFMVLRVLATTFTFIDGLRVAVRFEKATKAKQAEGYL